MIKNNRKMILISSIVILLPMLAGLLLWSSFPESIAIHWGADGQADGWGSKAMAVFGLPLFLFFIHFVCIFATAADPKYKDIHQKPLFLVFWICPFISLLTCSMVYANALGFHVSIDLILPFFFGALFVVVGNYMPKCKQNYSIGIKIPWTLNDEENWNHTHRLAGILWVVGGFIVMATALLRLPLLFFAIVFLMVLIPILYSYVYYKRHC